MSIQSDEEWARRKYSLVTQVTGSVLRFSGTIGFKAHYTGDILIYGRSIPATVRKEKVIEDNWSVAFAHNYTGEGIPIVWDTSGRLDRTRVRLGVSSQDMHLNNRPLDSFCVAPKSALKTEYESGFDLEHYFSHYLLPFLFQQSHLERHSEWPWWNYPHGEFGDMLWQMEQNIRNAS